jgi:hypothetical protein
MHVFTAIPLMPRRMHQCAHTTVRCMRGALYCMHQSCMHACSPAGCAVWCRALASTMRDLLLAGDGSAVLMATRLGSRLDVVLAELLLCMWLPSAASGTAVAACAVACEAVVLSAWTAGLLVAVLELGTAGKSAACTRPHAPCPSSLQRLLVDAVIASALNWMPTWHSGRTGGVSTGRLCRVPAAGKDGASVKEGG